MATQNLEQKIHTYLFNNNDSTAFTPVSNTANNHAYICRGAACQNAGTQDKLQQQIEQFIAPQDIGQTNCLGRCHSNNAFHYNGRNYSALSNGEMDSLFNKNEALGKVDSYHVSFLGTQILTKNYGQLPDFEKRYNHLLNTPREKLIQELETATLRERHGNGAPAIHKLQQQGDYFLCQTQLEANSSYADRFLLEQQPHLVLLSIIIAGKIAGVNKAILNIRGQYPESTAIILDKINELRSIGWLGDQSTENGFAFDIEVTQNLDLSQPLWLDIETTANLPFIVKEGGELFSKIGTKKSKGSKLVSFDGYFYVPGVYEIEMGTPFPVIIHKLAGGFREPLQALHIGGLQGGIIPSHLLKWQTLDFETLADNGFGLGHGGIIAVPDKMPILDYLKNLLHTTKENITPLQQQVNVHFQEEITNFFA